jgi:hypothetical protein
VPSFLDFVRPRLLNWLRDSRWGRALGWRAVYGWAWLSLQLLALLVTIRVGELVGSFTGPVRLAVLAPVVLVLFWIADVVSDRVDARVCAECAADGVGQRDAR